jgi:hypothetical protein
MPVKALRALAAPYTIGHIPDDILLAHPELSS